MTRILKMSRFCRFYELSQNFRRTLYQTIYYNSRHASTPRAVTNVSTVSPSILSAPLVPLQHVDSLQHTGGQLLVPLYFRQSHTSFIVPQQSTGQVSTVSPSSQTRSKQLSSVTTKLSAKLSSSSVYIFLHLFLKHLANAQQSPGISYTFRSSDAHLFLTLFCPVQPPHPYILSGSPLPFRLSTPHASQYFSFDALW